MNESIFRYGANKQEMDELRIRWNNANEYRRNTPNRELVNDLYSLFRIRGDEQAVKFLLENSLINNFVSTVSIYY